jgi:hypothetical protein
VVIIRYVAMAEYFALLRTFACVPVSCAVSTSNLEAETNGKAHIRRSQKIE